jgi:hypothetical protein
MRTRPYKRRPGDLEIRLLKDGRVVFVSPDQGLVEVARDLEGRRVEPDKERTWDDTQATSTGSSQ